MFDLFDIVKPGATKQPRSAPTTGRSVPSAVGPLVALDRSILEQSERPNDLKSVPYTETKVNKGAPFGFDIKLPSGVVTRAPSDAYKQGVREGQILHTINGEKLPKAFNKMVKKTTTGQWELVFIRPYRPRVLVNLQELIGLEIDESGKVNGRPTGQFKGKVRGPFGGGADQLCWVGTQEDESQPDSKWTWHRMTDNAWDLERMKKHLVEGKKRTRALLLFRSKERGMPSERKKIVLANLKNLCNHARSILQYRTLLKTAVGEEKALKPENPAPPSLAHLTWLWRRSSQQIIKSAQDQLVESILRMLKELSADDKASLAFLEQFHCDVVLRAIVASARLWKPSAQHKLKRLKVLKSLVHASKKGTLNTATRFLILDQLGYELDETKRKELLRMPAHSSGSDSYFIPIHELCNFPQTIKLEIPTGVGSVKEIREVTNHRMAGGNR
jgi:hypothetical protein